MQASSKRERTTAGTTAPADASIWSRTLHRRALLARGGTAVASALVGKTLLSPAAAAAHLTKPAVAPTSGVLWPSVANPRYFADGSGVPIYLASSNLGWELQDNSWDTVVTFDYEAYLDLFHTYDLNLIRLWMVEHSRTAAGPPEALATPMIYARSDGSAGNALDGLPKFDLDRFSDAYFSRLRSRALAAQKRNIYVAIMLFQGWSVRDSPGYDPYFGHPFNGNNNVNGFSAIYQDIHTLNDSNVTSRQEAYVRKVIDTVNDLDNVIFEICNEAATGSYDWQYHMIDVIHAYENTLPKQHAVGMTAPQEATSNPAMFSSDAEYMEPKGASYYSNPPASDGTKVMVDDTDHVGSVKTDHARFVWRSFTRGLSTSILDWSLVPEGAGDLINTNDWTAVRTAMKNARRYSEKMDLATAQPRDDLASTGFCLAAPGEEYLVYQEDPQGSGFTVDLTDGADNHFLVEWCHPLTGKRNHAGAVGGGGVVTLTPPWGTGEAVAFLQRVGGA